MLTDEEKRALSTCCTTHGFSKGFRKHANMCMTMIEYFDLKDIIAVKKHKEWVEHMEKRCKELECEIRFYCNKFVRENVDSIMSDCPDD